MKKTIKIFAKIPRTPRIIVTKFASNRIPCALKIGTMYGRITNIPQNCMKRNKNVTRMNGLSVRFRVISLNLSNSVGGGWSHLVAAFSQLAHDADICVIFFSWLNSVEMLSVDTPPRSICSVFWASSERFFESNQIGASGACKHVKNYKNISHTDKMSFESLGILLQMPPKYWWSVWPHRRKILDATTWTNRAKIS